MIVVAGQMVSPMPWMSIFSKFRIKICRKTIKAKNGSLVFLSFVSQFFKFGINLKKFMGFFPTLG